MLPRFSLRRLLIIVTLLAVASYALFVRPTVLANRLAQAVNAGDLQSAEALLGDPAGNAFQTAFTEATSVAEVSPREWSDVWHLRRTVVVSSSMVIRDSDWEPKQPFRSRGHDQLIWQQTAIYECGPFSARQVKKEGMHIW